MRTTAILGAALLLPLLGCGGADPGANPAVTPNATAKLVLDKEP